MGRSASKTRKKQAAKAVVSGSFGMRYAAVLFFFAFAGVIGGYVLKGSEAASLDYAAVFAAVAGIFAAVGLLAGGDISLSRSRLTYAWTAFMGWALVSAVVSGRFWASLVGESSSMLGWSLLAAMTAVALASVRYAPQVRRVFETSGWYVLFGESALIFWQLATGASPGGTLPNSTYLGEALLLLLPWTLSNPAASKWERWPRMIAVVVTLAALAASGARTAAVVGVAWAIWALARNASWSVRARTVGLLALVAVVVAAGLFFSRTEILGSASASALGQRPAMARISIAAVALRPVLGWGPDGYRAGGSAASTVQLAESGPVMVVAPGAADPHDVLLWVVVSTGLVGLALFVWFGTETVLRWRQRLKQGVDAWPAIWAVGGVIVVLLTAPAYPLVLPPLALAFGVSLWGPAPAGRVDSATERIRGVIGVAVLTVVALACGTLALDAAVRSNFENVDPVRSPQVAAGALSAARLWSVDPYLWLLASRQTGQAIAESPSSFPNGTDLAAVERAQALDSRNPDYPLQLAWRLQSYQAPPAQVEQAYQEVFERYPLQPQARAGFAIYLAGLGQRSEAQQQLTIAQILMVKDPVNTAPLQATIAQAQAAIAASGK